MGFDFFIFGVIGVLVSGWILRAYHAAGALRHMPVIGKQNSPNERMSFPTVSIVVPAKNEGSNIRACVEALVAQDYPDYEIIVINDNSTDKTEIILKELVSKHKKLSYYNASSKPEGWTGKNFAINYGIDKTRGEWLLFTDADTRHKPNSLRQSMAYALSHELRFLTLLPQCLAFGFMEKLIQPCAMTYLGLWFPIQKINDRRSKVYFANGQFILMERSLYESIGGHKAVRAAFLEDFAMMEKAKKMGAPICCALGVNVYGTRMYDSFQSIWRGWRRIFLHAFCEQPWELCRKMLSVLFFSVLPFALLLPLTVEMWQRHNGFTLMWGITTALTGAVIIICAVSYGIIRAQRRYALLHPLGALILALILLDAAMMAFKKKETVWR